MNAIVDSVAQQAGITADEWVCQAIEAYLSQNPAPSPHAQPGLRRHAAVAGHASGLDGMGKDGVKPGHLTAISLAGKDDAARSLNSGLGLRTHLRPEEVLRHTEDALRTVTDSIPALIGYIGADQRIIFANAMYEAWFARPRETLVGIHLRDLLGEVSYATAKPYLEQAFAGKSTQFENRVTRADQAPRDVWVRYTPHLTPGGRVEGIYVLALDITDGKQAMERVSFQSRLLDAVQQAMIAVDTQGHITFWNRAAEIMFRCPASAMLGKSLAEVTRAHVASHYPVMILQRLAAGETWSGELRIRRKRRSYIDAYVTTSRIEDAEHALTGYIGVIVDISERRKAEAVVANRARQQAAVAALGQRTLRRTDLQAILNDGVETVCKILDVEFCKLLELRPDGQTALLRAGSGWRAGLVGHAIYNAGSGTPASVTLASDAPVIVTDLHADGSFRDDGLLFDHDVTSGMSCVIADTRQMAYGVLGAYTHSHRKFTLDDANFLQSIANVLGGALQRHYAQAALRENEAMLQLALAAAQMGTWEIDMATGATKRSASTDALLRFPATKAPRPLRDYISRVDPDDMDLIRHAYRRAEREKIPLLAEFRIRPPGEEVRWVLVRGELVRNAQGETTRMRGSLIDITERKNAEERVRKSEQRFRVVSELMSDYAYEVRVEADAVVVEWITEAFERITGYAAGEVVPGVWNPQIYPEDQSITRAQLDELMAGQTTTAEYRILSRHGDVRWLRHRATPIVGEDGVVERVFGAVRDITERMRALEELRNLTATLEHRVAERTTELEHSVRELDEFVYIASHDLRAPLRSIDNLAGWVIEDSAAVLGEQSKEHLAKLRGRIRRMEALLEDLLDYSRAGRHHYVPELVDTGALIRSIVDLLEPPPGFTVLIDPQMPTLLTERLPLETTLRNLIGNAFKHHDHPARGIVSIRAQELATAYEFTVEDNGPGIAPEFHARIFNMFQTLRPRDQVEGSGAGLSIVKKMVESRGGYVTIRSVPGTGSVFSFIWPKITAQYTP